MPRYDSQQEAYEDGFNDGGIFHRDLIRGLRSALSEAERERDEKHAEIVRAQGIIDQLKVYRERVLTTPLSSTALMRARTRELATGRDDFDRAVLMILDDLERYIARAAIAAATGEG